MDVAVPVTVWCNIVLYRGKGWVMPWAVHLQRAWSASRSERRSVEWLPPLMPAEPHSLEKGHSGSLQLLNKQKERKLWDRCRMLKVRGATYTVIHSEQNKHWGAVEPLQGQGLTSSQNSLSRTWLQTNHISKHLSLCKMKSAPRFSPRVFFPISSRKKCKGLHMWKWLDKAASALFCLPALWQRAS